MLFFTDRIFMHIPVVKSNSGKNRYKDIPGHTRYIHKKLCRIFNEMQHSDDCIKDMSNIKSCKSCYDKQKYSQSQHIIDYTQFPVNVKRRNPDKFPFHKYIKQICH